MTACRPHSPAAGREGRWQLLGDTTAPQAARSLFCLELLFLNGTS